ncbi:hypothetical protein K4F52_005186 [Lecanicillium sp. MT-2017a]|nr:hypothetical protein K4F52_005186 [Lecanicillium sp. MT-2017a]
MKLFIATALLATLGLAAPVTETEPKTIAAREAFSCPGGLTNSSPMCCGANVLGVLALDCKTPDADGCSGGSQPNCCTLGLAGQGLLCQVAY